MSNSVIPQTDPAEEVERARCRWMAASDQASTVAAELFQPGSGYGCPEAEMQDRHRLETARGDAERLFREYQDLERDIRSSRFSDFSGRSIWLLGLRFALRRPLVSQRSWVSSFRP
jgi:hypothetical protein